MIEPFKFVGQLVAVQKDDDGNVTGEIHVADMAIYASQFDKLDSIVVEAWPKIVAQHESPAEASNGAAPAVSR